MPLAQEEEKEQQEPHQKGMHLKYRLDSQNEYKVKPLTVTFVHVTTILVTVVSPLEVLLLQYEP